MAAMPIRAACRLLLVLAATTPLLAQATADALQTRLLNQPLYLRGFWKNDKLSFDAAGKLKGHSGTFPFTLSGIEITKVDLEPSGLALEGRRVAVVFDGDATPQRVVLKAGETNKHDEGMHIEIAAPPGGDYTQALDSIFTADLASFVPSLPAPGRTSQPSTSCPTRRRPVPVPSRPTCERD
jgi:hypothetical protein